MVSRVPVTPITRSKSWGRRAKRNSPHSTNNLRFFERLCSLIFPACVFVRAQCVCVHQLNRRADWGTTVYVLVVRLCDTRVFACKKDIKPGSP